MCDFCDGKSKYKSTYCDLEIVQELPFIGTALRITNIHKGCPKFTNCTNNENNINIIFPIKYCPECGKIINKEE